MSTADVVTIDVFPHSLARTPGWRREARRALATAPAGLTAATVNHANTGTFTIVPHVIGSCLVLTWDSLDAAHEAWAGPFGRDLGPAAYSLDGEVTRARTQEPDHDWYGWRPQDGGAAAMADDEPLVAIVHGIVRRRYLTTFVSDNVHAASRAAFHPGHRGSIDVSARLPFENTSISLWKSVALAQDFAYRPGGHQHAMRHALGADTHRTGVYLRIRPLASTGCLGVDTPAFPDLPLAVRRGDVPGTTSR